jgi:hypothetical protein
MLWVQTFPAITNLLLVLSKSICRAIHCKHHSWSTSTIGIFFYPQIFIHHYNENHTWIHYIYTWIHYIHWSAKFLTNMQGVHAAHGGSTTSTTTHVSLQTIGILCGPLHLANSKRCCDLYKHFRGSTITHWKYLFKISKGYFIKSHFPSWFERYHRLDLNIYLTQEGRVYHHIQRYFSS